MALQTGVSTRHLARLIALEDTQPHRFIWEKRLQGAFRLLSQAGSRGLYIAEVAYRQGSPASLISPEPSRHIMGAHSATFACRRMAFNAAQRSAFSTTRDEPVIQRVCQESIGNS